MRVKIVTDTSATLAAEANEPPHAAPASAPEDRSPLDIPGVDTGLTRDEIVEFIHEGRGNDRW